MGIVNKVKDLLKSQKKSFVKKYDDYTSKILYFEIVFDKNNRPISCKVVESIPNNIECEIYEDLSDYLLKLVNKANKDYLDSLNNPNYYFGYDLYQLTFEEWQKKKPEYYNRYMSIVQRTRDKCQQYGINILNDDSEIISKIIDIVNLKEREMHEKDFSGLPFMKPEQIVLDNIEEEYKETIDTKKFESFKFEYYSRMIINFLSAFFDNFPIFLNILQKGKITENDRVVLLKYMEFLNVMPKLFAMTRELSNYADKITVAKRDYNFNRCKSNDDFISSLSNLLAKCDLEKEDLYVHATKDLSTSKSIINNGLYTFGELDSFSYPFESIDQIISYEYGNSISTYDSYIIIFRVPKDSSYPIKISKEEAKEAMNFINMRRSALVIEPEGKINSYDILGVIDKKNMRVIENPNFRMLSNEMNR